MARRPRTDAPTADEFGLPTPAAWVQPDEPPEPDDPAECLVCDGPAPGGDRLCGDCRGGLAAIFPGAGRDGDRRGWEREGWRENGVRAMEDGGNRGGDT